MTEDGPKRTSSALYLMAGGDPVTLQDSQKRIFADFNKWLRALRVDIGEANINTIVSHVVKLLGAEVATVALKGLQDVVNRNATKVDHEAITTETRYVVCSVCAKPLATEPLRRVTRDFAAPSPDYDGPTSREVMPPLPDPKR